MKKLFIVTAIVFVLTTMQVALIFGADTDKGMKGFTEIPFDESSPKKQCVNNKEALKAIQADPLSFMKECPEYQEFGEFKVVNVFSLPVEPYYQCIYTSIDIFFKLRQYRIKNLERLIGKQITVFELDHSSMEVVIVFDNLVFRANRIGGI